MQAGPGQMAQLDLRAMWLSRWDSVRVRVDGGEETLLQGTVLPPPESGGRRFRSKAAGNVTLVMVAGELTSLLFASFAVRAVCVCFGGNPVCFSAVAPVAVAVLVRPVGRLAHQAQQPGLRPVLGLLAF